MKQRLKRIIASVLCLMLSLTLFGCDFAKQLGAEYYNFISSVDGTTTEEYNGHNGGTTEEVSQYSDVENEEFNAFLDTLFKDSVTSDTVSLHYNLMDPSAYGIEKMTPTLGEFSDEDFSESNEELDNYLTTMENFDYTTLTKQQQFDYDVVYNELCLQKTTIGLEYYYEPLAATSGIQSNLPVTLAEYQFYTEDDVTDYLGVLQDVPRYYNQVMAFEQTKSQKGLFMSDFAADEVISQCEDFLSKKNDNVLITTFEERIDKLGLSEDVAADYKAKNKEYVETCVFPAYQSMIEQMKSLKGTGVNDKGLCNLPQGKEYYTYLVADNTCSSMSVEDVINMVESSINNAMSDLYTIYNSNPDAYEYYYDNDLDYGSTDPIEILDSLKEEINQYYPETSDESYSVKYVDKSLEDSLSPAFFMIPPIDTTVQNTIYLNNGSIKDDTSDLYSTLAHEGYPGHLYQTSYYKQTNPNPYRQCLNFGGYVEGWATYAELHSYEIADFAEYDEEMAKISQIMSTLNLGVSSRIDLGVNYEGWELDDVEEYLQSNGFDSSVGKDIYEYVIEEPANYQQYFVGYLQFMELQDYAKQQLESDFDLKEFNKALLDAGPCQFEQVRKYVDNYIQSVK